jgi:hypothetical protein
MFGTILNMVNKKRTYGRELSEFFCLPGFALYYSGDLEFDFLFCLISYFAMIANNMYLSMSIN